VLALHAAKYSLQELFFPITGDRKVAPETREKVQRQFFADYAAQLDVDEFMVGNPILIRARQAKSAGCLATIAIGLAACMGSQV
jgi:hypothetical protein